MAAVSRKRAAWLERARNIYTGLLFIAVSAGDLRAAPTPGTITRNSDTVGKYEKLELTVDLAGTFANPYDPDVIDLSAQFTSPSGKAWKINGFWDGSHWKIRFAANETGNWSYVVTAKDASGSASGPAGAFTCAPSQYHGWIKVAPNNRYLAYDDGTSFFGIGMCYCWSVTTAGLTALQTAKCNTWVYWNGTYDNNGGQNLVESKSSGVGKYDQGKCARVDSLLSWSEARGLGMIFVIWPHDYIASSMPGSWVNAWSSNPYSTLGSAAGFYSDATMWNYQQKAYRYMIARWGYSRGLEGWQTIDEISGTDGWSNQTAANAWTAKIGAYFHANDPFKHPTNGSHGNYWAAGNAANDLANTENYGNQSVAGWATLVSQLWNGAAKPAMSGEAGGQSCTSDILFATMANGMAMNPMAWQYNQGLSGSTGVFPSFANFVNGIDFAKLTNPAKAIVSVSGATAYGIKCDQGAFGWISGSASGKSLGIEGLPDAAYTVTFYDCAGGKDLSTGSVTVSGGVLTANIPSTSATSIAFKAFSPSQVQVRNLPRNAYFAPRAEYANGMLRLSEPPAENSLLEVMAVDGRIVSRHTVAAGPGSGIPIGALHSGLYLVRNASEGQELPMRLLVK